MSAFAGAQFWTRADKHAINKAAHVCMHTCTYCAEFALSVIFTLHTCMPKKHRRVHTHTHACTYRHADTHTHTYMHNACTCTHVNAHPPALSPNHPAARPTHQQTQKFKDKQKRQTDGETNSPTGLPVHNTPTYM